MTTKITPAMQKVIDVLKSNENAYIVMAGTNSLVNFRLFINNEDYDGITVRMDTFDKLSNADLLVRFLDKYATPCYRLK